MKGTSSGFENPLPLQLPPPRHIMTQGLAGLSYIEVVGEDWWCPGFPGLDIGTNISLVIDTIYSSAAHGKEWYDKFCGA